MQKLIEIIKSNNPSLSECDIFRALCTDVYQLFGADLISIWAIDDDDAMLTRRYLFENGKEINQSQDELVVVKRCDHPDYFAEILTSIYVATPDVRNDHSMSSLVDAYFDPNGIRSILDYVIYRDMVPVGIICCECRQLRDWQISDVEKIRSLTVALSFEFEAQIFPIE